MIEHREAIRKKHEFLLRNIFGISAIFSGDSFSKTFKRWYASYEDRFYIVNAKSAVTCINNHILIFEAQ